MDPVQQSWPQFLKRWPNQYMQDQHVTVIGPTDCGKTTLSKQLVECRGHVVALAVKYKDSSLDDLKPKGWVTVPSWSKRPRSANRVLVWPKADKPGEAAALHQREFTTVLNDVYKTGKWTIWSDELRYLCDMCGMRRIYQQMYITARSNKVSLVSAAQRPAHVPLEAYSSASHLFLYRTGDERDLIRMGGLNGTNAKQVAGVVSELPMHTFLHVNMRTGEQTISAVEL